MADDDMNMEKAIKKGKGFSASQIMLGFLFLVGLIIGGAATHYLIEPVLNAQLAQGFSSCTATTQRLNAEINSCLQEKNTATNKIQRIELTINGYGNELPATLTLYATGSMQLKRTGSVQPQDKPLSAPDFQKIETLIQQNDFWQLNDSYSESINSVADALTFSIKVVTPTQTKTVSCYDPDCPNAFNDIQKKVEEQWGEPLPGGAI